MDWFWCITLGVIVIRWAWRSNWIRRHREEHPIDPVSREPVFKKERVAVERPPVKSEEEKQRDRERAELRKQGYTDELIAVIIPTINNGQ